MLDVPDVLLCFMFSLSLVLEKNSSQKVEKRMLFKIRIIPFERGVPDAVQGVGL